MRDLIVKALWGLVFCAAHAAWAGATCELRAFSLAVSRYPVQTDPNATYYAAVINQEIAGNPSLIVSDDFPYSAYFSISVYLPDGTFVSSIKDGDIPTYAPNTNPNVVGNPVFATPRHFTIDTRTSHLLTLPAQSLTAKFVVVMRNYEAFNGQQFHPAPLQLQGGLTCDKAFNPDAALAALPQPPDPLPLPVPAIISRDYVNDVYFYKIGPTPFTDGINGYLGTSLDAEYFAVLRLPQLPSFFNTVDLSPAALHPLADVQYASIASYGANFAIRNVLTADQTKVIREGNADSAYFVLIPQRLLAGSKLYRTLLKNQCGALNFLVLQPAGIVPYGYAPYIVFREKGPLDSFPGKFSNVPLYDNGNFNDMTIMDKLNYGAQRSIAPYAPLGHQCSQRQFDASGCGYEQVVDAISACKNLMGQF